MSFRMPARPPEDPPDDAMLVRRTGRNHISFTIDGHE